MDLSIRCSAGTAEYRRSETSVGPPTSCLADETYGPVRGKIAHPRKKFGSQLLIDANANEWNGRHRRKRWYAPCVRGDTREKQRSWETAGPSSSFNRSRRLSRKTHTTTLWNSRRTTCSEHTDNPSFAGKYIYRLCRQVAANSSRFSKVHYPRDIIFLNNEDLLHLGLQKDRLI